MNNPIDKIQSYYEELTKTDKDIAVYIINNPRDIVTSTLESLALKTSSSKSALSRFAQRIGYTGFTEFKFDMARFLVSHEDENSLEGKDHIQTITETYSSYILKMTETLDREQIDRIADIFFSTNNIKIFGINRSYNSANQFKQRLARVGFSNISSEGDQVVIQDFLSTVRSDDVMFIFSTTDNSKFYTPKIKELKDINPKIVFITCNPSLPFRKQCYEYVVLPRISKDSYASFLDDLAIFFVFIEILIEAIARKYNRS